MGLHMLVGDQVALQEALREQQQIEPCRVRLPSEVAHDAYCRNHITENLRRLARTDQHQANLSAAKASVGRLSRTGRPPVRVTTAHASTNGWLTKAIPVVKPAAVGYRSHPW